ncbi:MAG TPA: YeeE/YedE family protein, partial [Eubacteriaceae bacterium]|nr:YeeE/YedE family protein [Eubacteriaceae bacterium]
MNNPKKWYEKSWPYFLGALLLSALQIITLLMTSNPWGITGSFPKLGAGFVELFGGNPSGWNAFSDYKGSFSPAYLMTNDPTLVRNLGLIFGALLSALLASQFKIKKIKSFKFALFAAMGGFLMGYGANIASGCN